MISAVDTVADAIQEMALAMARLSFSIMKNLALAAIEAMERGGK